MQRTPHEVPPRAALSGRRGDRRRPHRLALVGALTTTLLATPAHADLFTFTDVEGFEKCLQTERLLEKTKTSTGEQARIVSQPEIQQRCIGSAAALLRKQKDAALGLSLVTATKRLSAPSNALPLVDALTTFSIASCNELEAYTVLTHVLQVPKRRGWFGKASPVVKRCLADKQYRQDFLEELESPEGELAIHACDLLRQEKLHKTCKGSKP